MLFNSSNLALLLSKPTRIRMVAAVIGLAVVSGLDIVGVLVMLPLIGIFTGAARSEGFLGWASSVLGGQPSDVSLTLFVASLSVMAFAVKGVVTIAFRWWQIGFVLKQQAETSTIILRGYLRAPYSMFLERNPTELLRRLTDSVPQAYSTTISSALAFTAELITIFVLGLALLIMKPLVAVIMITYLGLTSVAIQAYVKGAAGRLGRQILDDREQAMKTALHAIGAVKEIRLRNNPGPFVKEYNNSQISQAAAGRKYRFLTELPKYLLEVIFLIGVGGLAVVLFAAMPVDEALGQLALFAAAGLRLLPSVVRLIASAAAMRFGRSGLEEVLAELQLLKAYGALETVALVNNTKTELGDIEFSNVSFAYKGTDLVLRDVSLVVPAGSSVALVGGSGAGKSTMVDLLLGLQSPSTGRISVGGKDIQNDLPVWQSQIAIVPQDVFLLDASIRTNIAFEFDEDAIDDDLLNDSIERAQLSDLITSSPEGLNTMVGDRGVRLSGGQRQRIGIARALYRRPRVLVLDEATSALDNETERRITETIENLQGDMTIVIVAHRLSTVRHCDQFVLLSQGLVAASGSFDAVVEQSAEFSNMVRLAALGPIPEVEGAHHDAAVAP